VRFLAAPLLLVHLAAVHWWLGALFPLLALTYCAAPATVTATMKAFSRRAAWIVGTLLAAGVLLAVILTGADLRLGAYQQRLLIKLGLVTLLLTLAAINKLRLTPLLQTDYARGLARLRVSIRAEIAVAFFILAASAWLVSTAPDT
jgi:putative copper export protein